MEAINDNDKYFGEYLRKNRCKLDGHSFKRDYHHISRKDKDVTIERCGRRNYGLDMEKYQEIEMTDLDEYFDLGFFHPSSYFGKRTFNTPEKWEDVQTLLNENAIKITKEFNRYNGSCLLHYDIPVTGHYICENYQEPFSRKKKENPQWFFWKGKYYDPSLLYFHHSSFSHSSSYDSFTPICPLRNGYPDEAMKLGRIEPKLNRIAAQSYYCPSSLHLNNPYSYLIRTPQPKKNAKNQKEYLEFDLGQVYELTTIGTLGGYPKKISNFYGDQEAYPGTWISKRRRRRYRRKYISIVNDPQYLCWVKRYSIFYRDLLTGKWLFYESFEGNHDVPTEVRHKISILARYIRVVPVEFQHAKDMRVLVYGEPHSTGESLNSMGITTPLHYKGMTKREKRQQQELDEGKDKEKSTIRYTVTPGTTSNLIFDGYPSFHRYEYCKQSDKKRVKYALIQDEFDAYCDEKYSTD